LTQQSTALEEKITGLAEAFNEAAEHLTSAQTLPSEPTPVEPPADDEPALDENPAPKRQPRRKGRIGKELTLDD